MFFWFNLVLGLFAVMVAAGGGKGGGASSPSSEIITTTATSTNSSLFSSASTISSTTIEKHTVTATVTATSDDSSLSLITTTEQKSESINDESNNDGGSDGGISLLSLFLGIGCVAVVLVSAAFIISYIQMHRTMHSKKGSTTYLSASLKGGSNDSVTTCYKKEEPITNLNPTGNY